MARQADELLETARHFDPLGQWSRVTRLGSPRRWKDLKFDALLAHEYRFAAEILLRFCEDSGPEALTAGASRRWGPRTDRLTATPQERSDATLHFRLSDRAAVVVALEGQSEMLLAKRILCLLYTSPSPRDS